MVLPGVCFFFFKCLFGSKHCCMWWAASCMWSGLILLWPVFSLSAVSPDTASQVPWNDLETFTASFLFVSLTSKLRRELIRAIFICKKTEDRTHFWPVSLLLLQQMLFCRIWRFKLKPHLFFLISQKTRPIKWWKMREQYGEGVVHFIGPFFFNTLLPLDPLINSFCICLFLPYLLLYLPLPSLTPFLSFAALVQSPLLLRGRGGAVGGEEAGERTAVSLSTVLLSPPSVTPVSSVCALVCRSAGFCGTSCL